MSYSARCLFVLFFVGAALTLSDPTPARPDTTPCSDVLDQATVFHDSAVSVSVTSSSRDRYCNFSINGFVADTSLPEEFGQPSFPPENKTVVAAMAQGNGVLGLAQRLFAADPEVDADSFGAATSFLEDNSDALTSCFGDFLYGKQGITYEASADRFTMLCEDVEDDRLKTTLIDDEMDVVRAIYFSR